MFSTEKLFMFLNEEGLNFSRHSLLSSVPYIIRLRQCLSEYLLSDFKNQRHLFNGFKYFSALPVILFSSLQKPQNMILLSDSWLTERTLYLLWYLYFLDKNFLFF